MRITNELLNRPHPPLTWSPLSQKMGEGFNSGRLRGNFQSSAPTDSSPPVVAKPEGAPLLLGQLVLEALDLVVDCGQQRLIPNPEAPDGMMLYEDY